MGGFGRRNVGLAILGAILVGAGVLVAILLGRGDPAPMPTTPALLRDAVPPQIADPEARPAPSDPPPAPIATNEFRDPAADRKEPPDATAGFVILRGRCVDAASASPLAGCVVALRGWPQNAEKLEEHVLNHGPVEWRNPEKITTSDDGLFSFSFTPPPPYQFAVDIRGDGRVPMVGRWIGLEPGTVKDFGDIRMLPGTRLTGRVVDEDGVPQEEVSVSFSRQERGSVIGDPKPGDSDSVRSASDGRFAARDLLAPGTWRVEVREREKIEPDTVVLEGGAPARFVEVRLRKRGAVESVSGVVVDDLDQPVRGASIEYEPRHRAGPTQSISSKGDGSFRFERGPRDPAGPLRLSAERNGYERASTAEPVSWGTRDLKLVLKRGLSLLVAVRNAATGEPVEDYGVRCFLDPSRSGRWSSEDVRLQFPGAHPGGVVELAGLRRGPQILAVEPAAKTGLSSAVVRFEVTDSGAPRQDVAVHPLVKKNLTVKRKNGTPVQGTRVELLRHWTDGAIDATTRAGKWSDLAMVDDRSAILLQEGKTNEGGSFALEGPPAEKLALRVMGPGHPPLVQDNLFLDSASGDLAMTVESGATLEVHLGPPEFLEQVRPTEAVAEAAGSGPRRRATNATGLALFQPRPGLAQVHPPGNETIPLSPEGRATIDGIPSGTWELKLQYWEPISPGSSIGFHVSIATVSDLQDGERRTLALDLSHLLKAELSGEVRLDGRPLSGTPLTITGLKAGGQGPDRRVNAQGRKTDDHGIFNARLVPGEYRLGAWIPDGEEPSLAFDAETFRVEAGQKLQRRFDLRTCTLKLQALASDGLTPVGGVSFQVRLPEPSWETKTKKTDRDGRAERNYLPPGITVDLLAWPKSLTTDEALRAFYADGKRRPEEVMFVAARVALAPPETNTRIVLPASEGY